jgi:flagellar biosynthesis protein FlhF
MKLKSFFADSIEEAIGLARREMGPEAMLVHSKRASSEARHLGAYEVVCAADTDARPDRAPSASARTPPAPSVDKLVREVSDLRQQMERLARSLTRCGSGIAGVASDPDLAAAFAALNEAELEPDLTYEIISGLSAPLVPGALGGQLRRLVRVNPELGCAGSARRVAALVGPPGAGKTSALVKLAVQYGTTANQRVQLLTLDTYRIGAADELQSYAGILGIGCQVLETPAALEKALAEHGQADLVLIDTPGLSRNEMDDELAQAIAAAPGIDTHLVLPASMRSRDLIRVAELYSIFKPDKLLFTRLDETQTFGPILNQSVRMGMPVSYLSNGQRIPEDLEAATEDRLLGLLVPSEPAQSARFGTVAA